MDNLVLRWVAGKERLGRNVVGIKCGRVFYIIGRNFLRGGGHIFFGCD